jgi:Icc-related predicted phosphoesterase
MPVALFTESNRREWMQRMVATGLGVQWTLEGAAADAATEGEMWALFSDTHIAEDAAKEARGVVMAENLERCVKQVLAAGVKPHGVLINGDCAYLDGQPGDYVQLVRCLSPLRDERVQVHCALGNHDDRKNFLAAMAQPGEEARMEGKHVSVLSSARVNWVLLDSLDEVNKTPGRLGEDQVGWLRRTLSKLDQRPTLVMVHHNPQIGLTERQKSSALLDTDALLEVLAEFPQVKALFFGHTHHWAVLPAMGGKPWLVNLPPVAYVFNEANPSGWVQATVTDKAVTLELKALNAAHEAHRQKVVIPLV